VAGAAPVLATDVVIDVTFVVGNGTVVVVEIAAVEAADALVENSSPDVVAVEASV